MDKDASARSDNPASHIRFEPSTVEKFNNNVLNTAGNVEPYSLEHPMHSSLSNSSAATTNPVVDPKDSSAAAYSPEKHQAERLEASSSRDTFGASHNSSGGGFFDRIKEKVSDLMHGHENPDKDSAFSSRSMASGDAARVEKSDSSNASTGGSLFSRDKSHDDGGSLPFALNRDVEKHADTRGPSSERVLSIAEQDHEAALRRGGVSDTLTASSKHAPEPSSSSTFSSLFSSISHPSTSASNTIGVSGPGANALPHPAAENTSDFSFWQPPSDAPLDEGGFLATGDLEGGPDAYIKNVSENTRHVTTWEGK